MALRQGNNLLIFLSSSFAIQQIMDSDAILLVVPPATSPCCLFPKMYFKIFGGHCTATKISNTFLVFSPSRSQILKFGLLNRGFCSFSCLMIV